MEPGRFMVAINNIENCVAQYGYRPDEVDPAHRGRFTTQDFEWLAPLLERQSCITDTCTWHQGDPEPDVDLDRFRGTLFRGFEGNYVEAYHRAFNLPFTTADYVTPWLEADPVTVKPVVVSRTPRYRDPDADAVWIEMAQKGNMKDLAVFVGHPNEYFEFIKLTGVELEFCKVDNFLLLANVIAGADMVCANQNFVYSLAMGLGKPACLETIKIKPLINNECYFPRENIQYF
jgi:hypothetical protein